MSINEDVLYKIMEFCDYKTQIKILRTNTKMYNFYQCNKNSLQKKFIKCILDEFNLDIHISLDDSGEMYSQLNSLKYYFEDYYSAYIPLKTFLSIITVQKYTNTFLFKQIYYKTKFTIDKSLNTRFSIYECDIIDMIFNGNINIVRELTGTLLYWSRCLIPVKCFANAILKLLKMPWRHDNVQEIDMKISEILRNYVRRRSFLVSRPSTVYNFYVILEALILNNKDNILNYVFDLVEEQKNKTNLPREFDIDYPRLLRKCLYFNKDTIFKMIHSRQIRNLPGDNSITIITPKDIKKMFKRRAFGTLEYILENMLGDLINLPLYIDNICKGISKWPKEFVLKKNSKIRILFDYLNDENKNIIQKYLIESNHNN